MSEPKRTRLVFLGFGDKVAAESALEEIKAGIKAKEIAVQDWALVHKAEGGKLSVTTNKAADPGAARGAAFGGGAGLLLAALSGPIGAGAVLGGAAIGAITAAAKDSGLKDGDIKEVSKFMADGRSGIMVAVSLDEAGAAEAFDQFLADQAAFAASDRRHQVDIVPGRTFEQALDEYRLHEED